MPDLTGTGMNEAIERTAALGLDLTWDRGVAVRCDAQPGTVVRQDPPPGTPVEPGAEVVLRPAELDVERFRGPCPSRDLGPVRGTDARLAEAFYRFAADPTADAPFADGATWVGTEGGVIETRVGPADRHDLAAWRLDGFYAERGGPFNPLDVLAASGAFYEVRRGVAPTCGFGDAGRPTELAGLRALSLTAPENAVAACMDWWSVTLFLDAADRIRGVALRLGAP